MSKYIIQNKYTWEKKEVNVLREFKNGWFLKIVMVGFHNEK